MPFVLRHLCYNILMKCCILLLTEKEKMDYAGTSLHLTIPVDSTNGTVTCNDTIVTVFDDNIVEYSEKFAIEVVYSDPSLRIGYPNRVTVVIKDDDSKLNHKS